MYKDSLQSCHQHHNAEQNITWVGEKWVGEKCVVDLGLTGPNHTRADLLQLPLQGPPEKPFKFRFSIPLGAKDVQEVNVPYVATVGPFQETKTMVGCFLSNYCFRFCPTQLTGAYVSELLSTNADDPGNIIKSNQFLSHAWWSKIDHSRLPKL